MLGLNLHLPKPGASPRVGGASKVRISRPVEFAFDFIARDFFKNYRRWCPQVVELEPRDGPVSVGVKARQVTLDRGIRSESTFEVSALDPGRRFEIAGLSEPFQSSYEFEHDDDGTALTFKFELREVELSMRPFVKLIRSALQDGAEQTVENLKHLLEDASARVAEPETI